MIRWAKVTIRFEALHRYPGAPSQVAFLAHPHRHEFHVTLWVEQFHNERDIEYLQLKSWASSLLKGMTFDSGLSVPDLGSRSCESIAEELATLARDAWGVERRVMVEVTEDGENGALIELPAAK